MTTTPATLGTYTQTRPRGFAPWAPQTRARELVAAIETVLVEYRDHRPLSLRQIFYVLVGSDRLDKTELAYKNLCETVNRARRAHLIPWSAIRDDGTKRTAALTFTGPADYLQNELCYVPQHYRRDRLAGQASSIEVWSEAVGMHQQLVRICEPFGVSVQSAGGFDSVTDKYDAAVRLADESRPVVILHIGDHDPSGVTLFDAVAADIGAFLHGPDGLGGPEVTFHRIAVTPEQVKRLDLATAPLKKTDRRGGFVGETTQAEAIPPDELARIVRDEIASHLDLDRLARVREAEQRDQRVLLAALRVAQREVSRP